MRFLIAVLLAGCATAEPVKFVTPQEKLCGKKATDFMVARYPDTLLDADGIPLFSDGLFISERYMQYAVVFERCMRDTGGYGK